MVMALSALPVQPKEKLVVFKRPAGRRQTGKPAVPKRTSMKKRVGGPKKGAHEREKKAMKGGAEEPMKGEAEEPMKGGAEEPMKGGAGEHQGLQGEAYEGEEPREQRKEGGVAPSVKVTGLRLTTGRLHPGRSYVTGMANGKRTLLVEVSGHRTVQHREIAEQLMGEIMTNNWGKQEALSRRRELLGY